MILVPDLKGENPDSARFSAQGDQAMRRQCLGFTQVLSYQGQCSSLCLLCLVQLLVTPWTVAHQAPLSTGFSRQEYWSGLPFRPLGDLPDSGIERISLASPALAGRLFTPEPPGKPLSSIHRCLFSTKKKKKKPSSHQNSLIAQLVKNLPAVQEILVRFLSREDPWKRDRLPTPVFLGFPCGSAGKESTYNSGDLGSIPGLRKSPGEGKGYPLQYSGLENSMDSIVHGVEKSWTRLSDFHFHQDCWTACFLLGVWKWRGSGSYFLHEV